MKKYLFLLLLWCVFCSCSDDSSTPDNFENLKADDSVTDAFGNTYEVGYEQASSNNQNPFVLKKDAQGTLLWKINHEESPVDGRALLIGIDPEDRIWVTFTVDGGSNENTYITRHKVDNNAFSNVFMNSYGSGGGAKVSVLAQINPETGSIIKGTFITARLTSGNTNSLSIDRIAFNDEGVLLETSSAAWPPGEGNSYQRYPNISDEDRIDGFFEINYVIENDLSVIKSAVLQ